MRWRRKGMEKNIVLCREDFKDFSIGEFPYDKDHSATGEYTFIECEI